MSDETEKPKIIVDSDWKEQVKAEKEAMRHDKEAAEEAPANEAAGDDLDMNLPPASFEMLISSLATQAAVALGQMPNPMTGQNELELPLAKHVIDTLAVLEEKTKGNLTDDEDRLLEAMLHQLRMAFIERKKG